MTHAHTLNIIGELINNAYARPRAAFRDRDLAAYQQLALGQVALGATYLEVNLDGTQQIQVKLPEMVSFLPDVIAALQAVTTTPLCFDHPSVEFHRTALAHYDRGRSGPPILNSIAASRDRLDEMIDLVAEYDTLVVVMTSEHFVPGGTGQCLRPEDSYAAARHFVERLVTKANRRLDQILIDPGLAPVGADTYGLVNIGLDAMRLISSDPDLAGVHFTVGLSNFAWGTPKSVRAQLEHAYLTLAMDVGLDFAIANPEKHPAPLPAAHPLVAKLRAALEQGRVQPGETQETAGFRQAEAILGICQDSELVDG
jgi:5-methyltetrahydrofolate--homocysteine methyltransferase